MKKTIKSDLYNSFVTELDTSEHKLGYREVMCFLEMLGGELDITLLTGLLSRIPDYDTEAITLVKEKMKELAQTKEEVFQVWRYLEVRNNFLPEYPEKQKLLMLYLYEYFKNT